MAAADPTAITVYTDKHKLPFLIDADDYEAVSRYSWCIDQKGYPTTTIGKWGSKPRPRPITLHVFLLGPAPKGLEWDHRNRIKTDNHRRNFRAVSRSVNVQNVGPRSTNTSGVIGVSRIRHNGRWDARIKTNGRSKYLGSFATLAEAAAARRAAEAALWPDNPGSKEA